MYWKPSTHLGKWSVGLIVALILLNALFLLLVAAGQQGGETFFSNPLLATLGILIAMTGSFAFFTGITTIVKNKERAILVYLATAIGFLVLLFVLGEVLVPH